jgi:NADH dehydrogenase/NADH:ubiquinone oxidoreductase subunit G
MSEQPTQGKVTFKVGDRSYQGTYGESLLGALRRLGYEVPSLCFHEAVSAYGACRLCLVEVGKGKKRRLTTSCNFPVQEGIEVFLDTDRVRKHRRVVLQLLLAVAPEAQEIQALAKEHGVEATPFEPRKGEKCILCGLCTRVCKEIVRADAIAVASRGVTKQMTAPYDETNEACIGCGACVYVCPTQCIGLTEEKNIRHILRWHRDLPMKACKKCGRFFAPTFQLNTFAGQIQVERSNFDMCQDCR